MEPADEQYLCPKCRRGDCLTYRDGSTSCEERADDWALPDGFRYAYRLGAARKDGRCPRCRGTGAALIANQDGCEMTITCPRCAPEEYGKDSEEP